MNRVDDPNTLIEPGAQGVKHPEEDQARFPRPKRLVDPTGDVFIAPFEQGISQGFSARLLSSGELWLPGSEVLLEELIFLHQKLGRFRAHDRGPCGNRPGYELLLGGGA